MRNPGFRNGIKPFFGLQQNIFQFGLTGASLTAPFPSPLVWEV